MFTYYAIILNKNRWEYVSSGMNPDDVYREAISIIEGRHFPGEEVLPVSVDVERHLKSLIVVPAEVARDKYRVGFPRRFTDEEY